MLRRKLLLNGFFQWKEEDGMNSIFELASCFLEQESMTHQKLQKLCYYYIAWGYALYDRAMIKDCEFVAWIHGPMEQNLYKKYSVYGWNEIPKEKSSYHMKQEEQYLFDRVWITYGDKCGTELEALTIKEEPWIEQRLGVDAYQNSDHVLLPSTMKRFYRSIYNNE